MFFLKHQEIRTDVESLWKAAQSKADIFSCCLNVTPTFLLPLPCLGFFFLTCSSHSGLLLQEPIPAWTSISWCHSLSCVCRVLGFGCLAGPCLQGHQLNFPPTYWFLEVNVLHFWFLSDFQPYIIPIPQTTVISSINWPLIYHWKHKIQLPESSQAGEFG